MRFIAFYLLLFVFSTSVFSQKYLLNEDVNKDTIIPKFGYKRKFDVGSYLGSGIASGASYLSPPSEIEKVNSWQFRDGIWGRMKLNKWYALGTYFEYARDEYRMKTPLIKDSVNNKKTAWTKQINNNLVLGLFNRINLGSENVFIDFGAYYAFDIAPRVITKIESADGIFKHKKTKYIKPDFMNTSNYGFDARITFKTVALYGRYRLTGLYKNKDYDISKLMIGVLFDFKKR